MLYIFFTMWEVAHCRAFWGKTVFRIIWYYASAMSIHRLYSLSDQLLRNTIDCSLLNISLNVKFRIWIEAHCFVQYSFLSMACLYWAFRAVIWLVIYPSNALERWRNNNVFIHSSLPNTLYLIVTKLMLCALPLSSDARDWDRHHFLVLPINVPNYWLPLFCHVETLNTILDKINEKSGPPLPPFQWCQHGAFFALLLWKGGGGGGRDGG